MRLIDADMLDKVKRSVPKRNGTDIEYVDIVKLSDTKKIPTVQIGTNAQWQDVQGQRWIRYKAVQCTACTCYGAKGMRFCPWCGAIMQKGTA